jgi:hypothetical protein
MKTLLHIGTAKTGSTALQDSLLQSHDYLRAHGVLYPRNAEDVTFNNHRLLAYTLMPFEDLPRHMVRNWKRADLDALYATFIDTVKQQIADNAPDCLVLSSETLNRQYPRSSLQKLHDVLDAFGGGTDVSVVVYVRRPSELYLSLLQQKLKASYVVRQPAPSNYYKGLQSYGDFFGADRVFPRIFARATLTDGDIVSDFFQAYLADQGIERDRLAKVGRKNESLSAEAIDIQRRYRLEFHARRDDRQTPSGRMLLKALAKADAAAGAGRPRLKPGIAEMVDYATEGPLWLRDAYGLEFPGYDYARLEREGPQPSATREYALHELVEIDPGVQAVLIEHVATSAWASEAPEHAAWLGGLLHRAG